MTKRPMFRRLGRTNLKSVSSLAVTALFLIYVGLTVLHPMQGFSFESALQGGIQDFRAMGACWNEWGEMQEFVGREAFFGADVGKLALDLGHGLFIKTLTPLGWQQGAFSWELVYTTI